MNENPQDLREHIGLIKLAHGSFIPVDEWYDPLPLLDRWSILQEVFFWIYDGLVLAWAKSLRVYLTDVQNRMPEECQDRMTRLIQRYDAMTKYGRYVVGDIAQANFKMQRNPGAEEGLAYLEQQFDRIEKDRHRRYGRGQTPGFVHANG